MTMKDKQRFGFHSFIFPNTSSAMVDSKVDGSSQLSIQCLQMDFYISKIIIILRPIDFLKATHVLVK